MFIDSTALRPGLLLDQLEYHLLVSDRFVPILTRDYVEGPVSSRELELAVRTTIRKPNLEIVPVVAEGNPEDYSGFVGGYVMHRMDCDAPSDEFGEMVAGIAAFLLKEPFRHRFL